jgi:UDP-N-acetylglucosamine acyltransferase
MIHSSAIIEEGAIIADDVTIGPFCHIGKNVQISAGCKLESNIVLAGKLFIDENVRVFSFAAIGHEGSDIEIGKKTHVREFTQIGTQGDEKQEDKIMIGNDNFIMGYVQIFSGVELGAFCIITNAVRLYENVKCEDRVIIGGLSTIEANNTIGTGVMIGGASYVTHDLPPFTLVEGNKASVRSLNLIGLRRRLENQSQIDEIKVIFKKVLGNDVDKELAKEIADTHENEYIKRFVSFIATSNM